MPHYRWSRKFFESRNRICLLTAANQIGKSSTQIRKIIHWATHKKIWPELWRTPPRRFWYLYPNQDTIDEEFHYKWVPDFLPKDALKEHPVYGWTAEHKKNGKDVEYIKFNSGVTIFFKSYSQKVSNLQGGTIHYIACDEELPEDYLSELQARTSATEGHFSMVFTPTLNQFLWRRAMEMVGSDLEFLPEAHKQQVSLYDCLEYEDGSETPWTLEKIKVRERQCHSQAEIDRRIHGRFVTEEGRKYPTYDPQRHFVQPVSIPSHWAVYSAVDPGSGGGGGKKGGSHPAAMVFIAVNPELTKGYVFRGWRGDHVVTTAGDILEKYREIRGTVKPIVQSYDWAAKDFGTIASRQGESFVPAIKSHAVGEDVLNTLFKNDMLLVFQTPELGGLNDELMTLMHGEVKNKARDDLIDATRYAAIMIPWNWEAIKTEFTEDKFGDIKHALAPKPMDPVLQELEERRNRGRLKRTEEEESLQAYHQELEFWNGEYGN